jgi:Domain of unknown function (DUF4263)
VRGRTNSEQMKRDLVHKVSEHHSQQGDPILVSTVVVHPGPRAWKEVSILTILDKDSGEIRRKELRAQTWKAIPASQGGGYDFTETEYHWHCEDDEIEAVREFLNGDFDEPGKYRLIRRGTELGDLLERIERDEISPTDLAKLIKEAGHAPEMVAALAASSQGALLAEAVELQRRRDQLADLRRIVENPDSTERDDIYPQLRKMGWIFGGRYIGESQRKQLTTGDVLDIPLLRPDGSLHVVELKAAKIPSLVRRHRGPSAPQETGQGREELPLVVGNDVHGAVGQAMNYLCHLDEDRDHILTRFKIETRRASATVLIGHPMFVQGAFTEDDISATLRIYNSHLARIEVVHYRDLIESAERDLALAGAPLVEENGDQKNHDETVSRSEPPDDDPWVQNTTNDRWSEGAPSPWSDEPPF